MINSHLLYQLSYAPGTGREKALTRGRRLAKRPRYVQQTGGVFPAPSREPKWRKSHRIPAAFPVSQRPQGASGGLPSEPFRTAMVPALILALSIAVAAIHAALVFAVPPAITTLEPVFHMGQNL